MIQMGCLARFFNQYEHEVQFATENGFDFMQLWYDHRGLCLHPDDGNPIVAIKKFKFPTIIHAVLNLNEFDEHIPKLLNILKELNHQELIIHPICKNQPITKESMSILNQKIRWTLDFLNPEGISVYLENNSKLDLFFTTSEEIAYIFKNNEQLNFLVDIAHIDNLNHLKEMVEIKYPKILHIADRNLEVIHEHLPIGQGNIDFKTIFKDILKQYNGKIILEIIKTDQDIINAKHTIENIIQS